MKNQILHTHAHTHDSLSSTTTTVEALNPGRVHSSLDKCATLGRIKSNKKQGMVKNVRKFNILSLCLTGSPSPAPSSLSPPPAAADIVSCTAVGKQTSTLVTITLELPLELELEPPSEPTFLINLTGAFAACNLPDRAEAEQRNSTSHKTYEGTCIFHEVLAFVPITIISPRAPASALIPRFLAPWPGQLVLWLHLNLQ